jgi:outer membrane protein TolC
MNRIAPSLTTLFLALSLAGAAQAQAAALSFAAALAQSSQQPSVISARAALATAQDDYAKAKVDPLGTKVTLLKAQQAYELAVATVKAADAQADSQIVSAYAQVLEAQDAVKVSGAALGLAQKGAQVAQTQFQKGGGTEISAQVAQNGVQSAQQSAQVASDGLSLATANLRSLVGNFTGVAAIPASALPAGVGPAVVETVIGRSAPLIQAQQAVAALQLQVNLLDPLAVSASQIAAVKTGLQQAQSGAVTAERGFRIQTQGLYNAYVQAGKNRAVKTAALQNAQHQLSADEGRFSKGLISQLGLLQSQIAEAQASLSKEQADDAALSAYYALLAGPSGR